MLGQRYIILWTVHGCCDVLACLYFFRSSAGKHVVEKHELVNKTDKFGGGIWRLNMNEVSNELMKHALSISFFFDEISEIHIVLHS